MHQDSKISGAPRFTGAPARAMTLTGCLMPWKDGQPVLLEMPGSPDADARKGPVRMSARKLRLSTELALPLEAVTQTFAILAKRGAGKTHTATVLVEELVRAELPVVVVDPVGVWWGLRSSFDGKSEGLPVYVFGGEHGDIPLEETAGAVVADFVVRTQKPVVLDLSLLSKAAARRFMTEFAEELYRRKATERTPLHVVLDEADAFAPQRTDHGGERLLGAINDLVRRGRARGLGVTLISQRPALVNKDVLTQIEVLVALRMTGPQDRDAIERWIEHHADRDEGEKVLASLASLEIGEAWVWSPGWLSLFKRVRIAARTTFDSSATPKVGERVRAPKAAADVDLEALHAAMRATVERAKADDPKALRAEIARLRKELEAKGAAAPAKVERVEVPALAKRDIEQLILLDEHLERFREAIGDSIPRLAGALIAAVGMFQEPRRAPAVKALPAAAAKVARALQAPKPSRIEASETLGAGERRVLTAIAQHIDGVTRVQLTALTGYKRSTRDLYLQKLGRAGLVAELSSKRIAVTTEGQRELGDDFAPLPTGDALRAHWLAELPEGERAVLAFLAEQWPAGVTREEVSQATGYKRSTRDLYVQKLARRELVTTANGLRASDLLFTRAT
jgi:hypothetical protein